MLLGCSPHLVLNTWPKLHDPVEPMIDSQEEQSLWNYGEHKNSLSCHFGIINLAEVVKNIKLDFKRF